MWGAKFSYTVSLSQSWCSVKSPPVSCCMHLLIADNDCIMIMIVLNAVFVSCGKHCAT